MMLVVPPAYYYAIWAQRAAVLILECYRPPRELATE